VILYGIHLVALIFVSDEVWLIYLGDFATYYGGVRSYFYVVIALGWFTAIELKLAFHLANRNHRLLHWFRPFLIIEGVETVSEEEKEIMAHCWQLTRMAVIFINIYAHILALFYSLTAIIPQFIYWDTFDVITYGFIWFILNFIAEYYAANVIFFSTFIVALNTIYFIMRFNLLNRTANDMNTRTTQREVRELIYKYNKLCNDVYNYNRFLKIIIGVFIANLFLMIIFTLYILCFTELWFIIRCYWTLVLITASIQMFSGLLSGSEIERRVSIYLTKL